MRRLFSICVLAALTSCACAGPSPLFDGGEPADGGATEADAGNAVDSGTPDAGYLPDCTAQRVVHLIGGYGGLAWFTLVWPVPQVVDLANPNFAYDDRALAVSASSDLEHPLYARKVGEHGLWVDAGIAPQPTVVMGFPLLVHAAAPNLTTLDSGAEMISLGARLQVTALQPKIPVIAFDVGMPFAYGTDSSVPAPAHVTTVTEAVALLADAGIAATDLSPSAAQLESWGVTMTTPNKVVELATQLAFTANAFRQNGVSTVMMPAFMDDPHGAFANLSPTTSTANALAQVLESFYQALKGSIEPRCGRGGQPLSLADNTVLLVTGDTPKNPFERNGWSDGVPGNANWIYVRSNGFLKPGWFGQERTTGFTPFDPVTGSLSDAGTAVIDRHAGMLGLLYAISRGDLAVVRDAGADAFEGLLP